VSEEYSFVVNSRPVSVRSDGTAPLLSVLRDELNLRGTKFGCGTEQCGACLVLVDGKPAYACTLPLSAAAGRAVTTVEGLSAGGTPHALQRALLAEQAAQCGYCISGITLRAAALLGATADPSEDEVRAALDPHLCRCGSHNRIVRAVLRAAREMREGAR
jgi:aerobic-type carbon monoxide dehydrogenase small subunit (CoxS/CutS family)